MLLKNKVTEIHSCLVKNCLLFLNLIIQIDLREINNGVIEKAKTALLIT